MESGLERRENVPQTCINEPIWRHLKGPISYVRLYGALKRLVRLHKTVRMAMEGYIGPFKELCKALQGLKKAVQDYTGPFTGLCKAS